MPLSCYRCDTDAEGELDALPDGWATRQSPSLGQYPICPACAARETGKASAPASGPQSRLRTLIERIERVEEDRAELGNDLREIYAEAKGEGYDVKAMRLVVRERRKAPLKRKEEREIFELYADAIGMEV